MYKLYIESGTPEVGYSWGFVGEVETAFEGTIEILRWKEPVRLTVYQDGEVFAELHNKAWLDAHKIHEVQPKTNGTVLHLVATPDIPEDIPEVRW